MPKANVNAQCQVPVPNGNANTSASASASLKPVAQFSLASAMASAHLLEAEHFSVRAFIFDTCQPHILKLDKNRLFVIKHTKLNNHSRRFCGLICLNILPQID